MPGCLDPGRRVGGGGGGGGGVGGGSGGGGGGGEGGIKVFVPEDGTVL